MGKTLEKVRNNGSICMMVRSCSVLIVYFICRWVTGCDDLSDFNMQIKTRVG